MKIPRFHLFMMGFALAVTDASAQPVPSAAGEAGPRLTLATNNYDFGRVTAGTLIKYIYVVTNTGDQVLKITGVKPGCHCTTAGDWSHHIGPGQSGVIPIQLDSANFNGGLTRTIMVTSNDKHAPQQMLTLHGTVWRPLDIKPQFVYLNVRPDGASNVTSVVHIVNETDEFVTLSEPTSANALFKASVSTIKPGKEFDLTVASVAPLPPGNSTGRILVKTSLAIMPEISITTMAVMQPALSVSPPEIRLPQTAVGATNTINIQNHLGKPLTLSNAQICCDPRAGVELKTILAGQTYQLTVTLPPGFAAGANKQSQISVKTDYAGEPVITVPIRTSGLPLPPGLARHP